jgi:hypothetical protein
MGTVAAGFTDQFKEATDLADSLISGFDCDGSMPITRDPAWALS